mgnify:CR=1 FL=1
MNKLTLVSPHIIRRLALLLEKTERLEEAILILNEAVVYESAHHAKFKNRLKPLLFILKGLYRKSGQISDEIRIDNLLQSLPQN